MIRINEIRSDHKLNNEELLKKASGILRIRTLMIHDLKILKESVDARRKGEILYIYSVSVKAENEDLILKKVKDKRVSLYEKKTYSIARLPHIPLNAPRPVVVGFGPAGMFAALYLSCAGFKPIVIERGDPVDIRTEKVREFWEKGVLDPESNVQFGEGGAGTFSDGKLTTGIKDRENRTGFVLETFVRFGADERILIENKPHIGSDVLKNIVKNIRRDILEHGGEVRFNSRFDGFETDRDGVLSAVCINKEELLPCNKLILSIGHSSRETFSYLHDRHMKMEGKGFAVGVRVQHLQEMIDEAMYGARHDRYLRAADYKLTFRAGDGRGVYSFCMCPGGYVVNSSSEKDSLCINGMSYSGRDGKNANSAIVVTVEPKDFISMGYGDRGVLSGMEFQRELEKRAFMECMGKIPCQRLEDFKAGRLSGFFGDIRPECKGDFSFGNIRNILPDFISSDIISAFHDFSHKIKGFDHPDTLLSGVESRTSSPVRILRNEYFLSSVPGIFPAGEGAGYAGGIMSAAIDGLKCAEALVKTCGDLR